MHAKQRRRLVQRDLPGPVSQEGAELQRQELGLLQAGALGLGERLALAVPGLLEPGEQRQELGL